MSFPNAPRRGKDDTRPDHFAYLRGYKGEELYGHLAGPIIWIELHTSDWGSKPCLRQLTGGELSCAKCKESGPVCKGACGFYHWRDSKPYFLWLDDSKRDEYDALRWLDKLKFGREKIKGSPVWVQKCFEQERSFASTRPQCRQPADLTESLLTIFGDTALSLWYRATHGRSDTAVSLPPVAKPAPAPVAKSAPVGDPMYRGAHRLVDAAIIASDGVDAATEEIMRRARGAKPSRNGKHKPPGDQE